MFKATTEHHLWKTPDRLWLSAQCCVAQTHICHSFLWHRQPGRACGTSRSRVLYFHRWSGFWWWHSIQYPHTPERQTGLICVIFMINLCVSVWFFSFYQTLSWRVNSQHGSHAEHSWTYFERVLQIFLSKGLWDHNENPGQVFILHISVFGGWPGLGNKNLHSKKVKYHTLTCNNAIIPARKAQN